MRRLLLLSLIPWLVAACGDDDHGGTPDAHPSPDAPTHDAALPDAALPDAPPDAAPTPPVFRNPVDLADDELARQALALLGGPVDGARASCNTCHGITRAQMVHWRTLSSDAMLGCLGDLDVSTPDKARAKLDCLRTKPKIGTSPFSATKVGVYASAARLPWFEYAFNEAYGADAATQLQNFRALAGMPRGSPTPFTQGEFDIVAEWFARSLPALDTYLPGGGPGVCTPSITPAVEAHVTEMRTHGWGAVNAEHGVLMHGCAGASSPRGCLTSYPRAGAAKFSTGWETITGTALRVLRENTTGSVFWTRSSPDGRFVALGSSDDGMSRVIDLAQDRAIPVNASYDPGFFPDNGAFMYQGWGARVCPLRVLSDGSPTQISLTEPGCSDTAIGLYQHVGASLGGGDYWAINGQWVGDNGGMQVGPSEDPGALFDSGATISLIGMVNTGTGFEVRQTIDVPSPNEGDHVISPSTTLVMSRTGGADGSQTSYVLRKIETTGAPGHQKVTTPVIGTYCARGAKPAFSYDERWLVAHHYLSDADAVELGFTGPNDPAFAAYRQRGGSNIYLVDLLTGTSRRITAMHAGQFALYPHFRSDGWLYFLVRDPDRAREYVVASDAALVLTGN